LKELGFKICEVFSLNYLALNY